MVDVVEKSERISVSEIARICDVLQWAYAFGGAMNEVRFTDRFYE